MTHASAIADATRPPQREVIRAAALDGPIKWWDPHVAQEEKQEEEDGMVEKKTMDQMH